MITEKLLQGRQAEVVCQRTIGRPPALAELAKENSTSILLRMAICGISMWQMVASDIMIIEVKSLSRYM